MTIEEYDKLPVGIIRDGIISNSPTGVFMTNDETIPLLRYVVIKEKTGWRVYVGKASKNAYTIRVHGDGLVLDILANEEYIKRCFPCNDGVFKLYEI